MHEGNIEINCPKCGDTPDENCELCGGKRPLYSDDIPLNETEEKKCGS